MICLNYQCDMPHVKLLARRRHVENMPLSILFIFMILYYNAHCCCSKSREIFHLLLDGRPKEILSAFSPCKMQDLKNIPCWFDWVLQLKYIQFTKLTLCPLERVDRNKCRKTQPLETLEVENLEVARFSQYFPRNRKSFNFPCLNRVI